MADEERKEQEIWIRKFTEEAAGEFRQQIVETCKRVISVEQPIVVYIDSEGGYVDSLAMMIETIDCVPNPIFTCCLGKAMSCGAILLSHGDRRYCGQHSRIMVHEVSGGAIGNVYDVSNDADEGIRLNRYWLGLLAKNCRIKGGYKKLRGMIKKRDGVDWWMTPQEALEFGLIDEIGVPMIEVSPQFIIGTFKR